MQAGLIFIIELDPIDPINNRVKLRNTNAFSKGGKTKCHITTELKTHCKSLCVRAFGCFAR